MEKLVEKFSVAGIGTHIPTEIALQLFKGMIDICPSTWNGQNPILSMKNPLWRISWSNFRVSKLKIDRNDRRCALFRLSAPTFYTKACEPQLTSPTIQ